MKKRIGIQGIKASFHHEAAGKYYGNTAFEMVEYPSFDQMCEDLSEMKIDNALMAIENTLAGSLLPNYLLMEKYHFQIIGEVYLRISLNLMALANQKMEDLKVIQSHPIALQQCKKFLSKYRHIKIVELSDTAESAKIIRDDCLEGYGAIASPMAAELYELNILAGEIETHVKNYTRFLVISPKAHNHNTPNKASLRFEHEHRPGSLLEALQVFADYNINLTKIQSVPVIGKPYQYSFHADLEWNDYTEYKTALEILEKKVTTLTHFGEYIKGGKPA